MGTNAVTVLLMPALVSPVSREEASDAVYVALQKPIQVSTIDHVKAFVKETLHVSLHDLLRQFAMRDDDVGVRKFIDAVLKAKLFASLFSSLLLDCVLR